MSVVDQAAESIIDFLMEREGQTLKTFPGQLITTLATHCLGTEIQVGDVEYHLFSRAILFLEDLDLVKVDRLHHHRHARANMLVSITLKED